MTMRKTESRPTNTSRLGWVVIVASMLTVVACTTTPEPSPSASPSTASTAGSTTNAAPPLATPSSPPYYEGSAFTGLAVRPVAAEVNPVLGADDRIHLAYELLLVNQGSRPVQLTSVATLDANSNTVIQTMRETDLARLFRPFGGATGTGLAPGAAGNLYFDVTLQAGASIPRLLRHTFVTASQTFTGVSVPVSNQEAVEIAPPLQGSGWVAGNGCCDPITVHRGALLAVDGTVDAAQRFAIDFVQIDSAGKLYTGNPADVASFPFFGTPIRAVADGTIVRLLDGLPEQIPGQLPEGATLQTGDGNYLVLDIGNGRFAFYAHIQPGSFKVKIGDRVKTGDVLGKLGNTGNTDAPHLHLHIMDGPNALTSNGLPFVFTNFTGTGVVTDEAKITVPFAAQAPVVPVDTAKYAGPHTKQLPLDLQVVTFP